LAEDTGAMSTTPGGIFGTLSNIFGGIGQSLSVQVQGATDTATQAFYVIAGELAVVIVLLIGIFLKRRD